MEQVVIVGGGPTGLMLACELRLSGVDVLVLERLAGPSGESRAGGIHARTMEILDMRGMLEPFLAEGRRLPRGHFAGIPLDFSGLPTRYPFLLAILQRRIERLLEARARDLGVRLRREVGVTVLRQTAERVEIETTEGDLAAAYVVGCDGGRSTVRKLAGIDFPGTPGTMTAILGDVELSAPPEGPVFQQRTPHGNWSVLTFESGWYRVITNDFDGIADRDAPITVDELRGSLRKHAGTDFGLHSPRWISRYNDAARLAARYRSGRVLLAGDAAHIHYPAGGQGLNTGVQDAFNLGWKLAAVLLFGQDQTLLDTYEEERRPVAERVLANTRAQTALTRPDPQTEALRQVLTGLTAFGDVNRSLSEMVAALDIRYPLPEGAGHRAPDFDLPDGTRLYEHLRDPRPVYLGAGSSDGVRAVAWEGPAMLIRPDGHVAWVEAMGERALQEAINRWCRPSFNE
ncbi:FAD-dependent monooxygenase [Paractinoplanes globisporus]|uniref:FAD-dependent monooxygenase n=1 Tax=Paractinoplanes globisporus TaxID=113565 RepID=A0ABW6WQD1_9ACTN|nr:FAD-dependent monooxygenase [Actinoplanes globisporus]